MKKINYLLFASAFLFITALASCSKDPGCQECHIAYMAAGATNEIVVEIGEFCGDALVDIEANGWIATEDIEHDGVVEYAEGDVVPASMIHCEEHADHDHADHDH